MISFVLGLLFGVAAIVAILFIAKEDRKGQICPTVMVSEFGRVSSEDIWE